MSYYFWQTIATATVYITLHLWVCLFLPSPITAEYWVRELIVVKRVLATSIRSPRVVFLGGSSTLFSIDARQVEAEAGLPAMNMGLHAGLSLDRVLSIGEGVARQGDIFVLPLEHQYYSCGQTDWTSWQVNNALAWDRSYFESLPLGTRIKAIGSAGDPSLTFKILVSKLWSIVVPEDYGERIKALAPSEIIWARYSSDSLRSSYFGYSAYNVDDRGDMLGNNEAEFLGAGVPAGEPNGVCMAVAPILSSFVARLKERGVQVIVAHEPYLVDTTPAPGWQESEAHFLQDIDSAGATVLDRREELFLPRTYFFDSSVHLNAVGRRERTKAVIADLRKLGIGCLEGC